MPALPESNRHAAAADTATPRWTRRKDARPGEILAAALALFVERGYAHTRAEDVAARAGISKGTLYLYFENKEALFRAVVRENVVPLIEATRADVASSDAPSGQLLVRFFQDWWAGFGATPLSGLVKLVVAEAGNFPEVARFFNDEVIRPNGEVLASIVARGIARGEFRPIDVASAVPVWMAPLVLKSIWIHSMQACCPTEDSVPVERFLAFHAETVLASLRPVAGAAETR